MINTNTYFGSDGSLVVSEHPDATEYTIYFGENGVVGRVMGVSVIVTTEIKAHYEIGSRAPKELRAGNIAIAGAVERVYINGAMLKLMLGEFATIDKTAGFVIPTFTMKLILDNSLGSSSLDLHGVMFDTWQVHLPEDDFMLEKLTFKAKRIAVTDNQVP